MDWKRSSANATRRVRMRRSCAGVTSWPPVVARSFQLSGYRSTGTPKRGTLARANEVLLVALDLHRGAVPHRALDHRGDLGRRTGQQLRMDGHRLPFNVPVDEHAAAESARVRRFLSANGGGTRAWRRA